MKALERLFSKLSSTDRRKSDRLATPDLAAYFWTNSVPVKQCIRDVSPTGFYLLTEERWYPGTLVMMTIQAEEGDSGKLRSIAVQSKAVRCGEDGVGLQFMLPEKSSLGPNDELVFGKADKKTLDKFLRQHTNGKG